MPNRRLIHPTLPFRRCPFAPPPLPPPAQPPLPPPAEVFRDWVPLLLVDVCSVSPSTAAMLGTVPSLSGALSVLAIGFISDRIGHRGPLLVFFLLVSVVCMIGLALLASDPDRPLAPVLILVAGSSVLSGPYSLLTACTMDCCGTLDDPGLLPLFQGLQDGSGYLFAATSGVLVGKKRDGQMQCSRLQVLGSWQWERLGLRCGWGVLEGREEEGRGGGVSVSCSGGLRRYPAAI